MKKRTEHPNSGHSSRPLCTIALLTGGGDKPYALGLASALVNRGICLDFIGSDEVSSPELISSPLVHFLNLRGDQSPNVSVARKVLRVFSYYARLIRYAAFSEPKIFHILWNNKIELLDRLLLLYYKLLGKKLAFTAHNVNIRKRDGKDTWLNRLSLRFQYSVVDAIFVHTEKMREELIEEFQVSPDKVTVIPFGINSTLPVTELTGEEARKRLGFDSKDRVLLFFGNIAPYKGLEYLTGSLATLLHYDASYKLLISGKPKNCAAYWGRIKRDIARKGIGKQVTIITEFIPDSEVELYFKAADVLILPYTHIFQSGVLFTSYHFGLPVIAADVGSLREDIIEGETGFLFRAKDSDHLASMVELYFQSNLYTCLESRRIAIRQYASEKYSWSKAGEMTHALYRIIGPECECAQNPAIGSIVNEP